MAAVFRTYALKPSTHNDNARSTYQWSRCASRFATIIGLSPQRVRARCCQLQLGLQRSDLRLKICNFRTGRRGNIPNSTSSTRLQGTVSNLLPCGNDVCIFVCRTVLQSLLQARDGGAEFGDGGAERGDLIFTAHELEVFAHGREVHCWLLHRLTASRHHRRCCWKITRKRL